MARRKDLIGDNWENLGTYAVYRKGSRDYIRRVVYQHNENGEWKFHCYYYGKMIELRRGSMEFVTVELY